MTHTQCENCLSDLEDYNFAYCGDCWDKAMVDLKKARPKVTMEQIGHLLWNLDDDVRSEYSPFSKPINKEAEIIKWLKVNGIEVKEAHVNSKVDERRDE